MESDTSSSRYAWQGLILGVSTQAATSVFLATPAFLIPLLHQQRGLSLAKAGLIAGAPNLGIVFTLVLWGAFADRFGERLTLVVGTLLTGLAALAAMFVSGYLMLGLVLLLGGMAAGSSSSASGKVVMGWFPNHKRGFAMGIRQMSQPLGVTIAALTVPSLAHHGIPEAFSVALSLNALLGIACIFGVRNPPRSNAAAHTGALNPYKRDNFLWRIHGVSVLLVIPQFTVATFGLVWLVVQLHMSQVVAGALVAVSQLAGAVGRIYVGALSDRLKSRVRPLRWVALSAIGAMTLMAFADAVGTEWTSVALVVASVITVADNGLAFTSVAEAAGRSWSGRALGVQNTGQFIAASAVGPTVGALIGTAGYGWSFLAIALCPLAAFPLIPKADPARTS